MEKKVTTLTAAIKAWWNATNTSYTELCDEHATNGDIIKVTLAVIALTLISGIANVF